MAERLAHARRLREDSKRLRDDSHALCARSEALVAAARRWLDYGTARHDVIAMPVPVGAPAAGVAVGPLRILDDDP